MKEATPDGIMNHMEIQNVTENYLKKAMPREGTLAYESGYQMGIHRKEIEIANWLYSILGGNITLLQETNKYKTPTPDYVWNGKYWELKSISSAKAADSALRGAVMQIQKNPGGVILELGKDIDMKELENVLITRFRRVQLDTLDILVLAHGILKKILRLKK